MAVNSYTRGQLVRVTGTFTDSAGNPVAPTTVTLKYRAPGGASVPVTGGSLVNDSTGVYHYDIDSSTAVGIWRYRWESTGTAQAANEGQFTVIPSALD